MTLAKPKNGFYGRFGGAYIPEILHKCVTDLQEAYIPIIESEEFKNEYRALLRDYVGRPSPLYYARRMSEKYGCQLYLKREDLNHTGAHKINNTIGQILMAKKMGKTRIIAETGAGQHGVATATVCALMDMECEVFMAILCLAKDEDDLRRRIENILLGYTVEGKPFTVKDLGVAAAITILLRDALAPNLVQTTENTAAFVHGGPFANIAHGCNSILATKMAMTFGEYVITEAGFGADLGAEKFFDIKCRKSGLQPKLTIVVATAQGLKMHGGVPVEDIKKPNSEGLKKGLANLDKHIKNMQSFGQTVIVAFNHYAGDVEEEQNIVREYCESIGVGFAINDAYAKGGEGAADLARLVVDTIEQKPSQPLNLVYDDEDTIETKIEKVCKNIYGAASISFAAPAKKKLQMIRDLGYENFPICIAKTQFSFSTDAKQYCVASGFDVNVRDIVINAGAEMIVVIAGNIMRMPGLPKVPAAMNMDIVNGQIEGLS